MATLKPALIRAGIPYPTPTVAVTVLIRAPDTLDLQDHMAPSAQNHATPPHSGIGAHQQEELRQVSAERHAEQDRMADPWGSGRSSHDGSELLDESSRVSVDDSRIDEDALHQNGGEGAQEDGDGDDVMDDRMSSSPSIDDNGWYSLSSEESSARASSATTIAFHDVEEALVIAQKTPDGCEENEVLLDRDEIGVAMTTDEPDGRIEQLDGPVDQWDLFEPDRDYSVTSISSPSLPSSHKSPSRRTSSNHWPLAPGVMAGLNDVSTDSSFASLSEEIDPDFVYALHNFVATVDGQANAAKGDAMVLLDDSNSYWWLVRLVKDGTIGYLPAEHIELPVEREARQNKHRNLELSRAMLHDDPGKSKNPLKKAMRRRNMKRVVFPNDGERDVFYEPSEHEWSDEEPDMEGDSTIIDGQAQADRQAANGESSALQSQQANGDAISSESRAEAAPLTEAGQADADRMGDEDLDLQDPQRVTKAGTIRNTDSFFADDTAEPRKISLTPNILRDESGESSVRSSGSTDKSPTTQEYFDQIDKGVVVDRTKDDRKRKEKRPGMLSGLFKRKDKKIKVDEAPGGTLVKHDTDSNAPASPVSETSSMTGPTPAPAFAPSPLQTKRGTGKLTKPPPVSTKSIPGGATNSSMKGPLSPQEQVLEPVDETIETPTSQAFPAHLQPDASETRNNPPALDTNTAPGLLSANPSDYTEEESRDPTTSSALPNASGVPGPYNTPTSAIAPPTQLQQELQTRQTGAISPTGSKPSLQDPQHAPSLSNGSSTSTVSALSPPEIDNGQSIASSRAHAGFAHNILGTEPPQPPHLETANVDTAATSAHSAQTSQFQNPPEKTSESQWNETAFQKYLDDRSAQDTRDMLLIVHDKSGVRPLPLDHPKMLGFGFHEHQKRLDEMQRNLDLMLQGFLARKAARPKGAVGAQRRE